MTKLLLAAAGLTILATSAFALDSETDVGVIGEFAETEDVSGIACADPMTAETRNCVVVVDEDVLAQRATLTRDDNGYIITPGDRLTLLDNDGDDVEPPVYGTPPATNCPEGIKKANEHDSEGITFGGGFYFATGSHGCGRNNDAARLSAFVVAKFRPDASGNPAGEISFRLNEVLTTDPALAPFFSKDLDQNGISIEGIAALGEPLRLYFGFRGPSAPGGGYILSVDAAALFTDKDDLQVEAAKLVDLSAVGPDMGIRDLAVIDDLPGRLMILVGPAQGDGGPFGVMDYDVMTGELGPLDTLDIPAGGKAEGLLLVDRLSTKAKILVLSDSIENGAPIMKIVALH